MICGHIRSDLEENAIHFGSADRWRRYGVARNRAAHLHFCHLLFSSDHAAAAAPEEVAGDKVTTSGGLRGTIMALRDDCIHLRVPPNNLLLEVTKASVVQVSTTEEPEIKTK